MHFASIAFPLASSNLWNCLLQVFHAAADLASIAGRGAVRGMMPAALLASATELLPKSTPSGTQDYIPMILVIDEFYQLPIACGLSNLPREGRLVEDSLSLIKSLLWFSLDSIWSVMNSLNVKWFCSQILAHLQDRTRRGRRADRRKTVCLLKAQQLRKKLQRASSQEKRPIELFHATQLVWIS